MTLYFFELPKHELVGLIKHPKFYTIAKSSCLQTRLISAESIELGHFKTAMTCSRKIIICLTLWLLHFNPVTYLSLPFSPAPSVTGIMCVQALGWKRSEHGFHKDMCTRWRERQRARPRERERVSGGCLACLHICSH